MFRSPSQAFGNCEDAKDEGEVKMLAESEGKKAKADGERSMMGYLGLINDKQ